MNLEGKCLEEFLIWYKKEDCKISYVVDEDGTEDYWNLEYDDEFVKLPDSMKWGVLEDYFDELETKNEFQYLPVVTRGIDIYFITYRGVMERFNSRQEARTAAIEKAVEIRNEQLNSK